tara:strand:+ start:31325 stop:31765 length:441 start_codon:yes stop_codon:yes gene_type:complete
MDILMFLCIFALPTLGIFTYTLVLYLNLRASYISYNIKRRTLIKGLQVRTRIFTRWLKVNYEKPYTIVLAALFPFAQAFLASILVIYTNPSKNDLFSNIILFFVAASYYFAFAMNSKRATKGSWLGLILLIVFGALGIVCGKLIIS